VRWAGEALTKRKRKREFENNGPLGGSETATRTPGSVISSEDSRYSPIEENSSQDSWSPATQED
jgi:hypothetical protein